MAGEQDKARQRRHTEQLLDAYVAALDDAVASNFKFRSPLEIASSLLFRWQGGESLDALRNALWLQWKTYNAFPPPGIEAERVGKAFGALCRFVGVRMSTP